MKIILKHLATVALFTALALLGMQNVSGLGHDFFPNKVVSMPGFVAYPKGRAFEASHSVRRHMTSWSAMRQVLDRVDKRIREHGWGNVAQEERDAANVDALYGCDPGVFNTDRE